MAREATLITISGLPKAVIAKADKHAEKYWRGNRSAALAEAIEFFFGRKKRAGRKAQK